MTTNFSKVLFIDETRAILDGPDGWSKSWVANECASSSRLIKASTRRRRHNNLGWNY